MPPPSDSPLVPLRFKLPYPTELEFLEKFAGHLSRGGVFLGTRTAKPEGTRVAFEFVLSGGEQVLRGEGVVAKVVAADPKDPGIKPGMTIRFTRLDSRSRAIVDRAVALKQGTPEAAAPTAARLEAVPSTPDPAAEARRRRKESILAGPAVTATGGGGPSPIIGIDLGTTNCRVAVHVDGLVKLVPLEGKSTALPSVVAFDDRGRMLLGTRARAQLLVDPKSAIFGAKRLIGRRARSSKVRQIAQRLPYEIVADEAGDAAVKVGSRVLRAPELASFLLVEIKNRASDLLGREVKRAVICVPAYFNDRQRQAVREAGVMAGLEVERILSEPTAVAIAFGYGRGLARKRLLVYDLGGGTFDAAILEATGDDYDVIAAGGDNFLGGLDFDQRLADDLERRFEAQHGVKISDPLTRQRIRDGAETAKITLTEQAEARVRIPWAAGGTGGAPLDLDFPVTRAQFELLTSDLVARTFEVTQAVLEARQIKPSAVDEVILVGGQSQSPVVRQRIEKVLGRKVRTDVDPHDAVAIGAALLGRAIRDDDDGFISIRLNEVLSGAIGIGMQSGRFLPVLEKDTRLPCEKNCALPVVQGGSMRVGIYQGENVQAELNEYLGALTVETDARGEINVRFSVSRDGVLALSARSPDGRAAGVTFATDDAPDEVRRALLASAPLPGELEGENKGLLRGLAKLFGGKK